MLIPCDSIEAADHDRACCANSAKNMRSQTESTSLENIFSDSITALKLGYRLIRTN